MKKIYTPSHFWLYRFIFILAISLYGIAQATAAPGPLELHSPDGKLVLHVNVGEQLQYSLDYEGAVMLKDCYAALELSDRVLGSQAKLLTVKRGEINEKIQREIPLRNAIVENHCNTLLLKFKGNYSVEFRAYNEGMSYRFITNLGKDDVEIRDEKVHIEFPTETGLVLSPTSSFITSYEISYVRSGSSKAGDLDMSTLPVLADYSNGTKILFSEADLFSYPCLFMKGSGENTMDSKFPRYPLEYGEDGDRSLKILKEADYIARTTGNRSFPWRVFMLSTDDRQIFENEMIFCLSRPNELGETSWIKPGQVSWEWWHNASLYGVDFKSGYNLNSYKYYIDFASTFGIPYIIMDEGWAASTRDPYTPNPDIDLFELIEYGKAKNVKIVLWLTWLAVDKNMDLFKTFSDWGIAGVKVDFMNRSDQPMVEFYERVAREAARNHLFVDFHGAFKPAGIERALPNILSFEGIVGMEQNIWSSRCNTANNAYLPFLRNAVGPADFTPGAMISAHPGDHRNCRNNPMSIGTRAYQLALYVVLESGIQMLADNPFYYYRERECTEFITSVPVLWDETKVLEASAGEYFVVAKRSGEKWYIGAITNTEARSFELDLSFLDKDRNYNYTCFKDGVNANVQAMDYLKEQGSARSGDHIRIELAPDGGWAAVFE